MKVILRKDVANVGVRHDVVDVSNGYAQNYLLRNELAEVATKGKLKQIEMRQEAKEKELEAAKERIEAGIAKLKGKPLTVRASANEKDTLFEAISIETIAAHLRDVLDVDIPVEALVLEEHIKTLGEHEVKIVVGEKHVPFTVKVEQK